jgi:hypothetical protein
MIKFEFKQTNQKLTVHYRPLTPVMGGTTQALPFGPTPVRTVPPDPTATSFRVGDTARPASNNA